jgi:hypothetical protein
MSIKVFGDSFSVPYNFDLNKDSNFCIEYVRDCLINGEHPKDWIILLEEHFGENIQTLSYPGSDNLTIFETVLKEIPLLEPHSIIIIGWSSIERVRTYEYITNFVTGEEEYLPLVFGFERDKKVLNKINKENQNFFYEWMLYKELHPNANNELFKWIQILNRILTKLNIIPIHWFWNPFMFDNHKENAKFEDLTFKEELKNIYGFLNLHHGEEGQWKDYETNGVVWDVLKREHGVCSYTKSIYRQTEGKIDDCHWTTDGHKIFSEILKKRITSIFEGNKLI